MGFQNKKTTYHHDESVSVKTTALVDVIADLLKVRQEVLMAALTYKRARVAGEVVVINYRMQEVSVMACGRGCVSLVCASVFEDGPEEEIIDNPSYASGFALTNY